MSYKQNLSIKKIILAEDRRAGRLSLGSKPSVSAGPPILQINQDFTYFRAEPSKVSTH